MNVIPLLAATAAVIVAVGTLAAAPAHADGWNGRGHEGRGEGWRGHEWREHERREYGGWGRSNYRPPVYAYPPGYYRPPVVYAPPPPVYYAPPPPIVFTAPFIGFGFR